jgi:hypothetical protein
MACAGDDEEMKKNTFGNERQIGSYHIIPNTIKQYPSSPFAFSGPQFSESLTSAARQPLCSPTEV